MAIVITRKHFMILASIVLGLTIVSGAFYSGLNMRQSNEPFVLETTVCGALEAPEAVLGIPSSVDGAYVTFEDGYTLHRTKEHSFYEGELGFFMLNGSVNAYALVIDANFDPCPTTE